MVWVQGRWIPESRIVLVYFSCEDPFQGGHSAWSSRRRPSVVDLLLANFDVWTVFGSLCVGRRLLFGESLIVLNIASKDDSEVWKLVISPLQSRLMDRVAPV